MITNQFARVAVAATLLIVSVSAFSQTKYEKGWQALNEAQVDEAVKFFTSASKKGEDRERALLTLTMLHSYSGREQKSSELFNEYLDIVGDPYPAVYALWKEEGVAGSPGKLKPHQLELMYRLLDDERNKSKLLAGTTYRLVSHYGMSFSLDSSANYCNQLGSVGNWLMVGPFDNVMNSGFDKDFGVVANPQLESSFVSKYGADVSWFQPQAETEDGYVFKGMFFNSSNSIIYTQTFVESSKKQEVYLNCGYSGSMKIWVNDSLLYADPERRMTEMDFVRFKLTLNEGYNRILLQLGEHEESFANFGLRFTDMNHNPLILPQKNQNVNYDKGLEHVEEVPYFAIDPLKKIYDVDTLLGTVLLAKAYKRSLHVKDAEELLLQALNRYPKNYIVLRELILLYDVSNNETNQNKLYRKFERLYPEDLDVLKNQIAEEVDKKNKTKVEELVNIYKKKYPNEFLELSYDLVLAGFEDDNEEVIRLIEEMYKKYPDEYDAVSKKYALEKAYYSNPEKATGVLEGYLSSNYNYDILVELASRYRDDGDIDAAIELLERNIELVPYSIESYRQQVVLLTNQSKYQEALSICHRLLAIRPSDFDVLQDVARLHRFMNNEDSAVYYLSEALRYFPFTFEVNETIRDLRGEKMVLDMIPEIKPESVIKDYEREFETEIKKPIDIVMDVSNFIVFKSKATGLHHSYIIKINDESAISRWQRINLSPSTNMAINLNDAFTIKQNGDKIDPEINEYDLVFTNLEVGDYVYVSYIEKQANGGKSSAFVWQKFALNSNSPTFIKEYNVYLEEGLNLQDSLVNKMGEMKVKKKDGFSIYSWKRRSPEIVPEEEHSIPFSDLAEYIHVALDYSWDDIIQWYSDLSGYQAKSDFTIQRLVKELFDGKDLTELEKLQSIYEFVTQNIRYSSIDFRQSGFIPQKASKVYHTRLGDCKDVSTLFAALAREAGLKANLVLVHSSNNGKNAVVLPSLNFNHCIVKAYYDDDKHIFLELTDQYLPFGHLYSYHEGAASLEIPAPNELTSKPKLERISANSGYNTSVRRKSEIKVNQDLTLDIEKNVIRTGRKAGTMVNSYFNKDVEKRREKLLSAVASGFEGKVTLKDFDLMLLEPGSDTALYKYSFSVESEVKSMGSFKSVKLPFSDIIIYLKAFQDGERKTPFHYANYENVDSFYEQQVVDLDDDLKFIETPENIELEALGNKYSLKFEKQSDSQMLVTRTYDANRQIVSVDDYSKFETFMKAVNDAENSYLIFK